MKLSIERGALLRGLGHVQSVVERRNTLPILSNLLLEAANGALSLSATDMDLDIRETVPATIAGEGATTAPAHTLFDIARKLRDNARIEIDSDGTVMTVRSGRSTFTLPCLPTTDYPLMSQGALPHQFEMSAEDLAHLIDRTRFAISTDETRYFLNGIFLHAVEEEGVRLLRAAATDGHRLSRAEIPCPEGAASMPGVILPKKTVGELRKLIDGIESSVSVAISDSKIAFEIGRARIVSKLIDGTFPDYERVIPRNNSRILIVDAKLLAEVVDRVATISTEKSRAVKLSLDGNVVTVSSNAPDTGSAVEQLEADYGREPLDIGFNARYLLDILDQLSGGNAAFEIEDGISPAVVRDPEDARAVFVLMPMRT